MGWSIELGRIVVLTEASFLSQQLCYPIEGHLDSVYRIFRYLQNNLGKNPGMMTYNPMYEVADENLFEVVGIYLGEWKDFYPDAQKMKPRNMPEALGKYGAIKSYVDANHAGNMANGRSYSDIIIYVNNAPIIWYSKRQNTVEASSFGSEFVALRLATEIIEALRYKLKYFVVPVEGPVDVFCDNKSVVGNSSIPT